MTYRWLLCNDIVLLKQYMNFLQKSYLECSWTPRFKPLTSVVFSWSGIHILYKKSQSARKSSKHRIKSQKILHETQENQNWLTIKTTFHKLRKSDEIYRKFEKVTYSPFAYFSAVNKKNECLCMWKLVLFLSSYSMSQKIFNLCISVVSVDERHL